MPALYSHQTRTEALPLFVNPRHPDAPKPRLFAAHPSKPCKPCSSLTSHKALDRAYLALLCLTFVGFSISAYRLPWPGSLPPIVFALIPLYHALLHLCPSFRRFLRIDEDEDEDPVLAGADDLVRPCVPTAYGSKHMGKSFRTLGSDLYACDPKPTTATPPATLVREPEKMREVYMFPGSGIGGVSAAKKDEGEAESVASSAAGPRRRSVGGGRDEMWVIVEDWN